MYMVLFLSRSYREFPLVGWDIRLRFVFGKMYLGSLFFLWKFILEGKQFPGIFLLHDYHVHACGLTSQK